MTEVNITADPPPQTTDARKHGIVIGRYMLHRQIARGGMATIHIGRLMGDEGFSRIVACKRLHPEFAEDGEFVQMFLDEARIASKIHHRNVVPVLDVVTTGDEVVLVQEYVHGVPLHWLLRTAHEAKTHVPINVAVSVACQVLAGLHAAHETTDEMGTPLNIVHRDVSPQNIMISTDGTARLLDFGVAKASMAAHTTRDGTFKGKLAYSAPEQIKGKAVRQSDIYAMGVVLWELIVGHRMHGSAQAEAELIGEIMSGSLPTITDALAAEKEWLGNNRWKQLETLEPIILRALSIDAKARPQTASDMEAALATAVPPASPTGVAAWLKALGKSFLEGRDRIIAEEEQSWRRNALSSAPRRLTPASLSAVRAASQSEAQVPVPAPVRPPAPSESRGKSVAMLGAIGALALALVVAIVFLIKNGDERAAATAKPVEPAATAAPITSPAPAATPEKSTVAAEMPPPEPPAAAPAPAPAPPPAPEPAPAPVATPAVVTTTAPAPHPTAPVRNAVIRRPVRVPPQTVHARAVQQTTAQPPAPPAAAPAPTPPPAPAPAAEKKDDCNPPYYFEGQKKVFKLNCI